MNDEFLELKEEIYSRLDIGTEISDEQLYAVVDECILKKPVKGYCNIKKGKASCKTF